MLVFVYIFLFGSVFHVWKKTFSFCVSDPGWLHLTWCPPIASIHLQSTCHYTHNGAHNAAEALGSTCVGAWASRSHSNWGSKPVSSENPGACLLVQASRKAVQQLLLAWGTKPAGFTFCYLWSSMSPGSCLHRGTISLALQGEGSRLCNWGEHGALSSWMNRPVSTE
jgi:hypothetical protein